MFGLTVCTLPVSNLGGDRTVRPPRSQYQYGFAQRSGKKSGARSKGSPFPAPTKKEAASHDGLATSNEVKNYDNQRYDEQYVDESAAHVRQEPDHPHDDDRPQ